MTDRATGQFFDASSFSTIVGRLRINFYGEVVPILNQLQLQDLRCARCCSVLSLRILILENQQAFSDCVMLFYQFHWQSELYIRRGRLHTVYFFQTRGRRNMYQLPRMHQLYNYLEKLRTVSVKRPLFLKYCSTIKTRYSFVQGSISKLLTVTLSFVLYGKPITVRELHEFLDTHYLGPDAYNIKQESNVFTSSWFKMSNKNTK